MTLPIATQPQSRWVHDRQLMNDILESLGFASDDFNIEEYWQAVDNLEKTLNLDYVRMDFGMPGLSPQHIAVNEHIRAIRSADIVRSYPPAPGLPQLRQQFAHFLGCMLRKPISGENVFVTCGGTQALFVAQAVVARIQAPRNKMVFLTPAYPPMISQARLVGLEPVCIEIGIADTKPLAIRLAEVLAQNDVAAICWASPNNPSWAILDQGELIAIAQLCHDFDVIAIEDLTYLGMVDCSSAPMQFGMPSISAYVNRYFLVASASKMFSYAGERIGFLLGSPELLEHRNSQLETMFETDSVRRACVSTIFNSTAGAPHSAQYAMTALLRSVNSQETDIQERLSVYASRAATLKAMLLRHGFNLIYHDDCPSANGFYVCFSYPGLSGLELTKEFLYCGIAVLPLSIFGSQLLNGVRACVGRIDAAQFDWLEQRLSQFHRR